jgi:hypothetical protein
MLVGPALTPANVKLTPQAKEPPIVAHGDDDQYQTQFPPSSGGQ